MKFEYLELEKIDFSDRLFELYNEQVKFDSASNIQIYNPIWVQEIVPGTYRLVDGFSQMKLLKEIGYTEKIPVLVFETETSLIQIWSSRILKRISEKNISIFSSLQALSKLVALLGIENIPEELTDTLNKLGIPAFNLKPYEIDERISILTKNCQFADLHALTYKEIVNLSNRKTDSLSAISKLLGDLQLKGNKLTSFLSLIDDLSKGYQITLEDLLNDSEISRIKETASIKQHYKLIKSYLSSKRWPVLSKEREKWELLIKKLDLTESVSLSVDPYFESDCIQFQCCVSSLSEFEVLLEDLKRLKGQQELQQLFEFL